MGENRGYYQRNKVILFIYDIAANDHDKCFAISAHTLIKLNNFSPINEITFNGKAYGEDGYNDVDEDTLNDIPENDGI